MSGYRRRLLMNGMQVEEPYSIYITTEPNQTIDLISTSFDVSKIDRVIVYDTGHVFTTFTVNAGVQETFPRAGSHKVKIKLKAGTNNFQNLFYNCSALTNVQDDIFNTDNKTSSDNKFYYSFRNSGILSVPDSLFNGHEESKNMFYSTFGYCKNLKSLPTNLFKGITIPKKNMFLGTFISSGLESIPDSLFQSLNGNYTEGIFRTTFYRTNITSIPNGLFSGIYGIPQPYMFQQTFELCSKLLSIPVGLFNNINRDGSVAINMFKRTFANCTSLDGQSATMSDGTKLYNIWEDFPIESTEGGIKSGCYNNCIGLDDYTDIPDFWKNL